MESSKNLPIVERLERLRRRKRWTWDELAEQLGVSRTTLHYLRTDRHEPTGRLLRRLEEAEQKAGMSAEQQTDRLSRETLREALQQSLTSARVTVRPEDHDRGYVSVKLDYLRGTPGKGQPAELKLSRHSSNRRAQLLTDVLVNHDYQPVLHACLPQDYANEEFLNLLTPFCIIALTDAAMTLVFGEDWKTNIEKR